ncbi:MAG: hypothetical protein JRI68_13620 [Deltaproteobacteria bacterium]|nr:hypothetical protein [Deltaproteobacteria bacterium]
MAMRRHSSGITTLTAIGFLVGGLYLAACSGAQSKPEDDLDPPPTDDSIDSPKDPEMKVVRNGPEDEPGDERSDEPKPDKDGPAPSDDYDMTYRDCKALAGTYYRAWRKAEMDKLEGKNFKPKLYETAKKNIDKAAQEAGDNWLKECEGTVGTPYLYSRLKCALKAKTIDRFNECLDGKAE